MQCMRWRYEKSKDTVGTGIPYSVRNSNQAEWRCAYDVFCQMMEYASYGPISFKREVDLSRLCPENTDLAEVAVQTLSCSTRTTINGRTAMRA